MEIKIKRAIKEHASIISNFQIKMALETEDLKLDFDIITNGVLAVFDDPSKGEYWIAVQDEKIIASMLMTPEWSDWRNKTVLWFQSVFVEKEHRGKGVFRIMYEKLKAVVESDPNLGGLRLYVDKENINAQQVYEKLGMNGDHYRFYEWMTDY